MPQRMQGYTEFRGAPWPPAGAARVPAEPAASVLDDVAPAAAIASPEVAVAAPVVAVPAAVPVAAPPAAVAAPAEPGRRMAGYTAFRGTPWPPVVGGRMPAAPAAGVAAVAATPAVAAAAAPETPTVAPAVAAPAASSAPASAPAAEAPVFTPGRRMAGYTPFQGAPWPPAAPALVAEQAAAEPVPAASLTVEAPAATVAQTVVPESVVTESAAAPAENPEPAAAAAASVAPAARTREAPPASATPAPPAKAARDPKTAKPAASTDAAGPSLRRRLAVAVGGVVVLGLLAVLGARWLVTLPAVAEFVARYPGVPALPEATPVGVPAWLAWQHFLNAFLMVLIIRTGLQVRGETRPPANFTPTKPGFFAPPGSTGKKFSLTIWMHQALDVLWLVNGLVFVVLLAATGHWRRLIPLDPETPQHMASTALQYATLDWPAHDGWLHYNALQMVAYAGVVFILAPLAALTGYRMSSWWPADNAGLSRAFPMEVARRLHFPTMIAISAFIVVHVLLVLFSGVLDNLNAMFLARDAADAWGLVAFLVAAAVTTAAWVLLKPAFVSPVAERFGRVGR